MKICLRNGCVNSVLMSLHHSDLGRASDWLKQIYNAAPPIQKYNPDLCIYVPSVWNFFLLVSQASFYGETSAGVTNGGCFTRATVVLVAL